MQRKEKEPEENDERFATGRAEEMQQESQGKRHSPRKRGADPSRDSDKFASNADSSYISGKRQKYLSGVPDQFASNADFSYVYKEGVVSDDDLKTLGKAIGVKWDRLARRLRIEEEDIEEIDNRFKTLSQRGFHMLQLWKTNNREAADYKTLYNTLVHELVQRKDLAEKYCLE